MNESRHKTNHSEAGSAPFTTILGSLTLSLTPVVLVGVAREVVELGNFVAKVIEINCIGEGIATKDVVFLAVVFITAVPNKAVRVGGGGQWRTCVMKYNEPRLV